MSKQLTQYKPGTSGNPSGRPKGFAGVARKIMAETKDGAELVDFALAVMRDAKAKPADRLAAHAWLADRALGKPIATLDLNAAVTATQPSDELDLSALSMEQLVELERIELRRAEILASGELAALPSRSEAPPTQSTTSRSDDSQPRDDASS